ncbi:MAG: hypothetical protein IJF27_04955 [Oscillospiraceae bacterium]|nr:hypothetical protein [Oscillospiraceae bacterium]MBQ3049387.1 hypothetical protein [Oscillospiraceae bacterium]
MKKFIAILLVLAIALSFAACANTGDSSSADNSVTIEEPDGTLGTELLIDFKQRVVANPEISAQELAEAILTNEAILFASGAMPMEPGYLSGFDAEITGFEECVMFAPMIGTIPFVGYIFTLADGADVAAFETTLSDNANPRWNICTEAEQTIISSIGNTVFFVMCPEALEE